MLFLCKIFHLLCISLQNILSGWGLSLLLWVFIWFSRPVLNKLILYWQKVSEEKDSLEWNKMDGQWEVSSSNELHSSEVSSLWNIRTQRLPLETHSMDSIHFFHKRFLYSLFSISLQKTKRKKTQKSCSPMQN